MIGGRSQLVTGTAFEWPPVRVIVPHYRDSRISICMDALREQDYPGPITIAVVDDGSPEPLGEQPGVVTLWQVNRGSYAARNLAAQAALPHEVLAFTDSDCVPGPDWLTEGVRELLGVGPGDIVGGAVNLFYANGLPSAAERLDKATAFPMEQYCVREGFAGAGNLFVRAATFHRLGGFDESLRSGGDTEFGLRVRAAGGRVHFARRAVVDHPARGASEQMAKARRFAAAKRDRRVRGLAHHRPGEVWRLILPYPRTVLAGLRLRGPLQHRLAAALWAVLIRWYEWWCCVMVIADKRRMRV